MKNYFVLAGAVSLSLSVHAATFARNTIGTPNDGSTVSGVGVISGYSCDSKNIEVFVDGISLGMAGAGTNMPAMAASSLCGHADVGYSLLYNFNKFSPGKHTVTVTADGAPIGTNTFYTIRLNNSSTPWVSGVSKEITIDNFPAQGERSTLDWIESYQNFVITKVENITSNQTLSAQLVGGTWNFLYTIITTFTDSYNFTSVNSTPDSSGNYVAYGTDEYGNPVTGAYYASYKDWAVLDPGIIIDEFYTFTFTDNNHVSGCYYQIDPPGSNNLSKCYPMTGARSLVATQMRILSEKSMSVNRQTKANEVQGDTVKGYTSQSAISEYLLLRQNTQ